MDEHIFSAASHLQTVLLHPEYMPSDWSEQVLALAVAPYQQHKLSEHFVPTGTKVTPLKAAKASFEHCGSSPMLNLVTCVVVPDSVTFCGLQLKVHVPDEDNV